MPAKKYLTVIVLLLCALGLMGAGKIAKFKLAGQNCPGCTAGAWTTLNIGGGGDVSGIMVMSDGTQLVRTDSASGYIRFAPGTKWKNAITATSISATLVANGCTSPCWLQQSFQAVCELVAAPSNTQHLYAMFNLNSASSPLPTTARIYSTTNQGATWTLTDSSFSRPVGGQDCNSGGTDSELRNNQPYIAVDPGDEAVVWAGDSTNGAFFTLNTGTLWTNLSTATIPAPVNKNELIVAFDPRSAQHTVYVGSAGNGIWKCTSANTSSPSCTKLNTAGMPTRFHLIKVDAKGTVWVIDKVDGAGTGNLFQWQSGSGWTAVINDGADMCCFDVDPGDSTGNTAFALDWNISSAAANLYAITSAQSSGAGLVTSVATITGVGNASLTANTVKWPVSTNYANGNFLQGISMAFDPSQSHQLYITTGIGVTGLKNPPTVAGPFTFNRDETIGIENLVGETAFSLTTGGIYFIAADLLAWLPANVRLNQYTPMLGAQMGVQLIDQANGGCTNGSTIFGANGGFTAGGGGGTSFGLAFNTSSGAGAWSGPIANPNVPGDNTDGSCVIIDATHWLYLAKSNGPPQMWFSSTVGSTNSFSHCTFNNDQSGNAMLYNDGGWINAVIDAASTVLFYNNGGGVNVSGRGVWQLTNAASGCSGISQVNTTLNLTLGGGFYSGIAAVPGLSCSGNMALWAASGTNPHGVSPFVGNVFQASSDCGTTWPTVIPQSKVEGIFAFGFGKALAGSDGFPTLYCLCSVSFDGGTTYKTSIWQIVNADGGGTMSFNDVDPAEEGYPAGVGGFMTAVTGDLATAGTVYACFNGQSCVYRTVQ